MKKVKSILRRNFAFSLGFGICMGLLFPLYALLFAEFKTASLLFLFSVGCVVAGILVGVFGYIINTRSIIAMAKSVIGVMEAIPAGVPVDIQALRVDSDDILGRLIDSFSKSLTLFQESMDIFRKTAGSTISISDDVEHNLTTTMESSRILVKTIDLIGNAANELDIHNVKMEEGFDLLTKAILLNVTNIIELYTSINEFGLTIFKQTENFNQLMGTMTLIEESIGSMGEKRHNTLFALQENLGFRVQETVDTSLGIFDGIKNSLDAIDGIAERTNILSINAAIEAARLGKEGNGFRIIAGNIKVLATEVHTLTSNIESQMQSGEKSLNSVTKFLNEALSSQAKIIGSIQGSIRALTERNDVVSSQMTVMENNRSYIDDLLRDIKENMQNLKTNVSNSRESLSFVVNTSMILHGSIGTLSEKAKTIEENGKMVNSSLKYFKDQIEQLTLLIK